MITRVSLGNATPFLDHGVSVDEVMTEDRQPAVVGGADDVADDHPALPGAVAVLVGFVTDPTPVKGPLRASRKHLGPLTSVGADHDKTWVTRGLGDRGLASFLVREVQDEQAH